MEQNLGVLAQGTERVERDGAHLVVGCGCVAEKEDAVFRNGTLTTGGLIYIYSDGDEDVLRGRVDNGVV